MSSDFFKKLQPLFEAKEATDLEKVVSQSDEKRAKKYVPGETALTKKEAIAQLEKVGKRMSKPANVKESGADFFRKFVDIVTESEEAVDEAFKKENKSSNERTDRSRAGVSIKTPDGVGEIVAEYKIPTFSQVNPFTRTVRVKLEDGTTKEFDYKHCKVLKASQVTESYDDEDEDPDVKKAEAVKGKDGKKQADFEKGKKWSFDKADKKAEDKAAKKVAKDKDLTESSHSNSRMPAVNSKKYPDLSHKGLKGPWYQKNGQVLYFDTKEGMYYNSDTDLYLSDKEQQAMNEATESVDTSATAKRKVSRKSLQVDGVDLKDSPDFSDAYFCYGEYTDGTPLTPDQLDKLTDKYSDIVNELAHASTHGALWDQGGNDIEESADASKQKVSRHSLKVDGVNQDDPEDGQAYFSYGEYTDGTPLSAKKLAHLTSKYRDIVDIKAFASVKGCDWDQDAWGDDTELEED